MKKIEDTLFLQIISGELPSRKIYEDEHSYAFLSTGPVSRGHTLVIPKKHARNIHDVDTTSLSHVISTVQLIANHIKNTLGADGINIHQNNEPAAGQVIFHLHFHVIPRYNGDTIEMWQVNENLVPELAATHDLLLANPL